MAPGGRFTGALKLKEVIFGHKTSFLLLQGNNIYWCAEVSPSGSQYLYEVDEIISLDQAGTLLLGNCFILYPRSVMTCNYFYQIKEKNQSN